MKSFENEIELLRSFYYAMELPVRLLAEQETVFSMPDRIVTAAELTENAELLSFPLEEGSEAQYIVNAVGEYYIYYAARDEFVVAVGPFLLDKPSESFINDLARSGRIALREKTKMQEYYASLSQISRQRYFYVGRLLERLFSGSVRTNTASVGGDVQTEFIRPEYYEQTREYRMQQFLHSPYMMEQELCRAIGNGDDRKARLVLKEINSRPRARLASTAVRSMKNSMICSCTFMTRAAIGGGVKPDEAFTLSDTYIQRIEECTDFRELLQFEEFMVNGFALAVKAEKSRSFSNAVILAMSYIDTHLCEPITIRQVADAVYLSPNYLSGLFSRETGETIHSFILRRRIEEASYFVRSSTDAFADIASFYQFSTQSHFVQSFKHFMGVTPGVYRRGVSHADGKA